MLTLVLNPCKAVDPIHRLYPPSINWCSRWLSQTFTERARMTRTMISGVSYVFMRETSWLVSEGALVRAGSLISLPGVCFSFGDRVIYIHSREFTTHSSTTYRASPPGYHLRVRFDPTSTSPYRAWRALAILTFARHYSLDVRLELVLNRTPLFLSEPCVDVS